MTYESRKKYYESKTRIIYIHLEAIQKKALDKSKQTPITHFYCGYFGLSIDWFCVSKEIPRSTITILNPTLVTVYV